MASRTRRHLDIWPGYVDVLSTLLMVIIFTLMVFVIAQFFLSQALSGRDQALAQLSQKVSELGDMLALEKTTNTDLRSTIAELSAQLQQSTADRDKMKQQLATATSDRDAIAAALAAAQADAKNKAATDAGAKAEVDAKLADAYKVIDADRAKVQTLLGDIAALESLRDDLTQKLANSSAESAGLKQQLTASQAEAAGLQNQAADLKTKLGISQADAEAAGKLTTEAELQIELLNRQMTAMREQLAQLSAALDVSEAKAEADEVQITDLGKRLNEALANKVAELARYRSEFFGKLREVLGNRSDVQIVGDRFIFQSEVLFATGSAEIGDDGKKQLAAFAATLKDISAKIPTDIDWLLRVDGHTDKQRYHGRLGTNWELSSARAIAVVKFLIDQGIPPNRLVAAGFAEFRPLAEGDSPDDLRRNRRIELKLDQR